VCRRLAGHPPITAPTVLELPLLGGSPAPG
jgi:hypothetical protein